VIFDRLHDCENSCGRAANEAFVVVDAADNVPALISTQTVDQREIRSYRRRENDIELGCVWIANDLEVRAVSENVRSDKPRHWGKGETRCAGTKCRFDHRARSLKETNCPVFPRAVEVACRTVLAKLYCASLDGAH